MTMMTTVRCAALMAALACGGGVAERAAAATVTTGDTVTCADVLDPFAVCSRKSATIGDGAEFTFSLFGTPTLSFDFSDDLLTITGLPVVTGLTSDLFVFKFTNATNAFTSATLIANSAVVQDDDAPFAASRISVADGVLSVDLGETRVFADGSLTIALSAGPGGGGPGGGGPTPAVPEPATWAMMLAGFGGIGAAMRRRRRATARLA